MRSMKSSTVPPSDTHYTTDSDVGFPGTVAEHGNLAETNFLSANLNGMPTHWQ